MNLPLPFLPLSTSSLTYNTKPGVFMVIHFRIRWHGKYLQHFRMVPANTSE